MEFEVAKKIQEIKKSNQGTTGVLLVDQYGLAIDSTGNLDKAQSGLMSSIINNSMRLQQILSDESALHN